MRRLLLILTAVLMTSTLAWGVSPDFIHARRGTVALVIRVEGVETRLRMARDVGEYFYFQTVRARVEEVLSPDAPPAVGKGASVTFCRPDFRAIQRGTGMLLVGERYAVWMGACTDKERQDLGADWMVEKDDLFPVQGQAIAWGAERLPFADVRGALAHPPSLTAIANPMVRLEAARRALSNQATVDDALAALMMNLRDPDAAGPVGEGMRETTPWMRTLETLEDLSRLAVAKPALRDRVLAGLRPFVSEVTLAGPPRGKSRLSVDVALVLASLGDESGRAVLWTLAQGPDFEIGRDPSTAPNIHSSMSGRFYSDSSRATAAYALGRIGDERVLGFKDPTRFFAGLDGLGTRLADRQRSLLVAWLKEPRGAGGESDPWLRARVALVRLGDDARLLELLRLDHANSEVAFALMKVTEPNFVERVGKVAARAGITSQAEPVLQMLGGGTPRPRRSGAARDQEIVRALDGTDAELRGRALAAAGRYKVDSVYGKVLEVALHGSRGEQRAALEGIIAYGRPLPAEAIRTLLALPALELRVTALDLATAEEGPTWAAEALVVVRSALEGKSGMTDLVAGEAHGRLSYILARLLQGGPPPAFIAGLDDPDPRVRRIYAQAVVSSRSPALRAAMEGHAKDDDPKVRELVETYLRDLR